MNSRFVYGNPLTARSQSNGLKAWQKSIIDQTLDWNPVDGACKVHAVLYLSEEAFATAGAYGSDLDNLLKPLIDSLKQTVLKPDVKRVVAIAASKAPWRSGNDVGILVTIEPIAAWPATA